MLNARTSRTKTLVRVADVDELDHLTPDLARIEDVCALAGSTGLYPYAPSDPEQQVFDARQFPASSGYPEDAATGIAAAALAFGLLHERLVDPARHVSIRQGRAMARPSRIELEFQRDADEICGIWLGGSVHRDRA